MSTTTERSRSCDDLGVCQHKAPRCEGCISSLQLTQDGIRFAPGALEAYRPGPLGTPAQRRELLRWARQLLAWGAVMVACGLLAGVVTGRLP